MFKRLFFRTPIIMLALLLPGRVLSQGHLVFNGASLVLHNSAVLVIANPDTSAIIRTSGYLLSDEPGNRVIWEIGAGAGNTYIIPFGDATNYFPLKIRAASGSGPGRFIFNTYPTGSWDNSLMLPPGVTNLNNGTTDNSAKVIDRFWLISPQGYTTKPTLSFLEFNYADAEIAVPNTIIEAGLIAQRWNNVLLRWDDYVPISARDPINNKVTVSAVPGPQLYDWWTLVDQEQPLPVTLVGFDAVVSGTEVNTSWITASEQNVDHFEVWRSRDGRTFEAIGQVTAMGNSALPAQYALTDNDPFDGVSYYKLRSVDVDGRFSWLRVVTVHFLEPASISVYPNPVSSRLTIQLNAAVFDLHPRATLYDARGNYVKAISLRSGSDQVDVSSLAAGLYQLKITFGVQTKILPFIKR